jgi:two-component system, LuxR family, response regulator FixJ
MPEDRQTRVAVVDDDEAVRDSLRFLLEMAGFDVLTFASADAFLPCKPRGLARLLIDQHMPHVTGLELLRSLRERGCQVSAALMTGSPSADLIERARRLGAVAVLEKPLRDDLLLEFMSGALD